VGACQALAIGELAGPDQHMMLAPIATKQQTLARPPAARPRGMAGQCRHASRSSTLAISLPGDTRRALEFGVRVWHSCRQTHCCSKD
jgi:hypothetical protein